MSFLGRVPVDPEEGVECLVCGAILRTLGPHYRVHGLTSAEYRKQFPGAPVSGEIHKAIRRDLWEDRVARGEESEFTRGKWRECSQGHRLSPRNLVPRGDGRGYRCRKCLRAWQRANPKVPTYRRASYQRHREKRQEESREYYEQNREAVLKKKAAYYKRNPEMMRERAREYRRRKKLL